MVPPVAARVGKPDRRGYHNKEWAAKMKSHRPDAVQHRRGRRQGNRPADDALHHPRRRVCAGLRQARGNGLEAKSAKRACAGGSKTAEKQGEVHLSAAVELLGQTGRLPICGPCICKRLRRIFTILFAHISYRSASRGSGCGVRCIVRSKITYEALDVIAADDRPPRMADQPLKRKRGRPKGSKNKAALSYDAKAA